MSSVHFITYDVRRGSPLGSIQHGTTSLGIEPLVAVGEPEVGFGFAQVDVLLDRSHVSVMSDLWKTDMKLTSWPML